MIDLSLDANTIPLSKADWEMQHSYVILSCTYFCNGSLRTLELDGKEDIALNKQHS
jgi:hypothetical protein